MVIVMQEGASDGQIQQVIDRLIASGFNVHRSTGVSHTVLGAVGVHRDFDHRDFELLDGVREVMRITQPFKLASREFRPEGTIVDLGRGVKIGGPEVVVAAGPCSVESREQIFCVAEHVAKAGAKILRGGAFKPRTSPYAFQGMGEPGLKLMREAADKVRLFTVRDRKSTRLNSSHRCNSYAVLCLKKKKEFALIREAARRTLGTAHYRLQIMGAIAIFEGGLAEMQTGEEKTLTTLMPTFRRSLPDS